MKRRGGGPARDTLSILVGRGRVTLLAKGEERPVSMHAGRDAFIDDELLSLLEEYIGDRKMRGKVVIGVDPSLDFLAARPRVEGGSDLLDELEERHGDRLLVEEQDSGRFGDALQRVYAAPERELREAAEAVREKGRVRIRFHSATAALQRMAEDVEPTPSGWDSEIRYFPGPRKGLAVFVCAGKVLTRQFLSTGDRDEEAIASVLASMWAAVQEGLQLPAPAGLVLHCGDSGLRLAETCQRILGAEARVAPHLGFDQATLCRALASDTRRRRGADAPLFRPLAEKVGGGEPARIPILSLAGTGAVLALVASMLQQTAHGLDAEIMALDARTRDAFVEYGRDPWKLRETRETLRKNARVAEAFLMDRVYWSDILGEVPGLIPGEVSMQRLDGVYPLHIPKEDEEGDRRPNAYVELTCSVPVLDDATRIPEVPQFTKALRESELIGEHFRHVPNAEVNVRPDATAQVARVSIRCSRSKR